jgi:nucleoid-associated protein YgaU
VSALAGQLLRAALITENTHERLDFHYNPTSLKVTKTASWTPAAPARGHQQATKAEFQGTDPRRLELTVLFDALEKPDADIIKAVGTLGSWACATKESFTANKPQPPLLHLSWGKNSYFPGYLKSVIATYTLFSSTGTPLRASVDIVLEETPEEAQAQNPTSGGVPDRRSVVLGAGDSLASLSQREYGDPNLWRALAAANGIDDPLRVAPGRTLVVPPPGEARTLSGAGRG